MPPAAPPESADHAPPCRFCAAPLRHTLVDLGMSPLCQTHIEAQQLDQPEVFYPLHARVCEKCFLVQLGEVVSPQRIFDDYAYFSSYSDSWVEHAKNFATAMVERLGLDGGSLVVEVASNDGYLLQHFVGAAIPCLGIEPAANVARVASERGIETLVRYFGTVTAADVARQRGQVDLLVGNNVLAHVPDLNDFVAGIALLLKPDGVVTMEFPHLQRLLEDNQFDTIYHEHFSYFSFFVAEQVFARHGLTLFDVEELPTHGGSLRIFGGHAANRARPVSERVRALREREHALGLDRLATYAGFGLRVAAAKRDLLEFLIDARRAGKRAAGYGAPGKGNTLLNYCGIRSDLLDYTVDRSPYKQGRFTPGTRIPIYNPDHIRATRPDYVLILPWNLADEITRQMAYIAEWGGRFVVPIPRVRVL